MTAEDFKKAGDILDSAVEMTDPTKRAAYLNKICGDDKELRAEVDALLKAHDEAGDFLKVPNVTLETSPSIEGPGTRIGHYELLELIGEG